MESNISIEIAKKEVEKAIIGELCKKGVLDFCQYNNIIKNLDDSIIKLKTKSGETEDMTNMIVKIPI